MICSRQLMNIAVLFSILQKLRVETNENLIAVLAANTCWRQVNNC